MNCSVLILTKDEARNIADCIASASFSDDIVVFDSFSTDDTPSIAESAGARVFQHAFTSYGAQREAARTSVSYRYDWILALDADERVEPELAKEIPEAVAHAEPSRAAFRLRRKDYFHGHWIRHSTLYPSWHIRLYRRDRIYYPARLVHEYPEVDGTLGRLNGHLIHDNFSKGLAQWWQRHLRYAELEAAEIVHTSGTSLDFSGLVDPDPVKRRRTLKALSYRLPFRPELRLLYMLLIRGGGLDGPKGWEYCRMIAQYQRITDQIANEFRRDPSYVGDAP